jgi:outer membrane immunogenic protein
MRRLLLSSVSVLALTFTATAQTSGPRAATWTGFYIGGSLGGVNSSGRQTISGDAASGAPLFASTNSGSSFVAGAFAGYNFQISPNFVVGGEADISGLSSRHRIQAVSNFPLNWSSRDGEDSYGVANVVGRTSMKWMGTLRARAGVTFDNIFLYGTGGLAFGAVKSSTNITIPEFDGGTEASGVSYAGSTSKTKLGWALGVGAEMMITDRWTARLEYLHYDLGSVGYTMTAVDIDGGGYPRFTSKAKVAGDLVRVGLAYKF